MLLHGQSEGVWIGLQDADTMKWTNGKPVKYTNWSPVEPKHSDTVGGDVLNSRKDTVVECDLACDLTFCVCLQQDEWLSEGTEPLCTVLSNTHNFHFTGKWYKEKCTQSGYGFVCQKPQGVYGFVYL